MTKEKHRYPWRMDKSKFNKAAKQADKESLSINQLIDKAVTEYLNKDKKVNYPRRATDFL